jgi:hypothetical protein
MRKWIPPLAISLLGIAAGWAAFELLWRLWPYPNQEVGRFSFVALDLALLLSTALSTVCGYRITRSFPQLRGIVGPLLYAAGWGVFLHSLGECTKPCLSFTYTLIEYAEGLAPLLGTLIGYAYLAAGARMTDRAGLSVK